MRLCVAKRRSAFVPRWEPRAANWCKWFCARAWFLFWRGWRWERSAPRFPALCWLRCCSKCAPPTRASSRRRESRWWLSAFWPTTCRPVARDAWTPLRPCEPNNDVTHRKSFPSASIQRTLSTAISFQTSYKEMLLWTTAEGMPDTILSLHCGKEVEALAYRQASTYQATMPPTFLNHSPRTVSADDALARRALISSLAGTSGSFFFVMRAVFFVIVAEELENVRVGQQAVGELNAERPGVHLSVVEGHLSVE